MTPSRLEERQVLAAVGLGGVPAPPVRPKKKAGKGAAQMSPSQGKEKIETNQVFIPFLATIHIWRVHLVFEIHRHRVHLFGA